MNPIVVQDTNWTRYLKTVPVSKHIRDIYMKRLQYFCLRRIFSLRMNNTLFITLFIFPQPVTLDIMDKTVTMSVLLHTTVTTVSQNATVVKLAATMFMAVNFINKVCFFLLFPVH